MDKNFLTSSILQSITWVYFLSEWLTIDGNENITHLNININLVLQIKNAKKKNMELIIQFMVNIRDYKENDDVKCLAENNTLSLR